MFLYSFRLLAASDTPRFLVAGGITRLFFVFAATNVPARGPLAGAAAGVLICCMGCTAGPWCGSGAFGSSTCGSPDLKLG